MKFGDQDFAARMRDTIYEIVDKRIAKLRPTSRDAIVEVLDPDGGRADVKFLDEPDGDPIPVRLTAVRPNEAGQIVRVEGTYSDRYVAAVYGEVNLLAPDAGPSITVVYAGSDLTVARPVLADVVYWVFDDAAVDVGAGGVNIVNRDAADFWFVPVETTTITVVHAESDLSASRPSGADVVYWVFDDDTVDPGTAGENIVNGAPGDLWFVPDA